VVASYEKSGEKGRKPIVLSKDLEEISLKIKELLKTEFCAVSFVEAEKEFIVNNITLSPDFELFKEVTGKNIGGILLSHLAMRVYEKRKGLLEKFVDSVKDTIRWVANEISNIGPFKQKV